MRRARVRAVVGWLSAALVIAGAFVAVAALGPEAPTAEDADDGLVPSDLLWPVVARCLPAGGTTEGYQLYQGADGEVVFSLIGVDDGDELTDPDSLALAADVNDCLDGYRFAEPGDESVLWTSRPAAQALLLYDRVNRWTAPCLLAHGIPVERPELARYLDPNAIAWSRFYGAYAFGDAAVDSLDELIEARRACGQPTDILAADPLG
ncbi:hypothetical protein [Protaetiibacter intestinalis]|uniref:Uncharacterized protein n=1 Tax=Protaetiibacter intestinalis TaxID=2419774 RepID=A0A387BEC6_9MICO|nr:hypothetical protein [Protaetiibacter intestinalis]AYF96830.1 hypothetical protein D7I47_00220 [Protaetiibacter intestinalis]